MQIDIFGHRFANNHVGALNSYVGCGVVVRCGCEI